MKTFNQDELQPKAFDSPTSRTHPKLAIKETSFQQINCNYDSIQQIKNKIQTIEHLFKDKRNKAASTPTIEHSKSSVDCLAQLRKTDSFSKTNQQANKLWATQTK